MARLLVVEDDPTIGGVLYTSLRAHDHAATWERPGSGALAAAASLPLDLVLLDLGLPDLDGVEFCRQLRSLQPAVIIVMLTARAEEMDVVVGLEAGADDYLTKPVGLAELPARIRAHLRRDAVGPGETRVQICDLVIDTAARRVEVNGREVGLRSKEYELLARLAAEPVRAISREQLMADVWDEHWFGSTKTLDVHIAALRRKLTDAGTAGTVPSIVTLRGHGYRLADRARG